MSLLWVSTLSSLTASSSLVRSSSWLGFVLGSFRLKAFLHLAFIFGISFPSVSKSNTNIDENAKEHITTDTIPTIESPESTDPRTFPVPEYEKKQITILFCKPI